MFKRLIFEDWTLVMPVIAFFFTFAIFIYTTWCAMKLPKSRREDLAALPLEDSEKPKI